MASIDCHFIFRKGRQTSSPKAKRPRQTAVLSRLLTFTGMTKNSGLKGIISYINHDKGYATIEFQQNEKKKNINFKLADARLPGPGPGVPNQAPKSHHFRTGDHVSFEVQSTERTGRMIAAKVKFLYNQELEKIIQQARKENIFKGFLKIADGNLYVKELTSYLFFPLTISRWEKLPPEKMFNEAVDFTLLNIEKPDKMSAMLFTNDFIPEYRAALRYRENKTVITAIVFKVSPYAVYLNMFHDKIQAKLPVSSNTLHDIKVGDKIEIRITYLSPLKIVVEKAG